MSRSIHTTRRSVREVRRKTFPTPEEKEEAVKKVIGELRRKRRIKRQVFSERHRSGPPSSGGFLVSTIPIETRDEGQLIHHAASVEDLRAILGLLPSGATEGITRIRLNLGAKDIEKFRKDPCDRDRDPYTNRLSIKLLPGVYSGDVLGFYQPKQGAIALHSYVYDPSRVSLPLPICEIYLKLHALKTFVHEVAHHHDDTQRVARGRWLSDRKENFEWYAEKMEHQWTKEIVVPYLEKTYPNQVSALRKWVKLRGGLLLPLDFFAGDHRSTLRNGLARLTSSTSSAFERWVWELLKHKTLIESHLAFAWELHYADEYDSCLKILDGILKQDSGHLEAMVCKADTLMHLECYDDAVALANAVISVNALLGDAWKVLGFLFSRQGKWRDLLSLCDRWEQVLSKEKRSGFQRCQFRAVAFCALDDLNSMEQWIKSWANFNRKKRNEENIRRTVFRRAGKKLA